ncbi:hypothetical protein KIV56_06910 [Cryobacterium breve]|uniref:Uncharacterized protein n=1 Tax=Cryobacterium breve TaxID=1259258 RepID=A0ABY7NJD6_9MICO|nr:hypothetical protein [Cryobacterium breve]WBM80991.1 hypothetical protein KIV56_06910 [Cryobacterium breve]
MIDSATTSGRSERMAATALRLTAVSRRLTAERGLNGFTIEEALRRGRDLAAHLLQLLPVQGQGRHRHGRDR